MAGHSKWAQIKRKKAVTDAQKSKEFGKLLRKITVAARDGADPSANAALRAAIDKAREANTPSSNIDRALERARGAGPEALENVLFEAYGPSGAAILI